MRSKSEAPLRLLMFRTIALIVSVAIMLAAPQPAPGATASRHEDDPARNAAPPAPAGVPALPDGAIDLSTRTEELRTKHGLPALAVAALSSDRVLCVGLAGVREADGTQRVTIDDRWHLGSCTKAMTATLAAALVHKGVLTWETTVAETFPDVAPTMHAGFRPATLAQLCTNRAGVPGSLDAGGLWGKLWKHTGTPLEARRLLLEGVVTRAPEHKPGTKFEYSNGGFAIAGHMCEVASGKDYEDLLRELVFDPLGMKSAGYGPPGSATVVDEPRGHNAKLRPQSGPRADNPPGITPAGRVHASLLDWGRFCQWHLRAAREAKAGRSVKLGAIEFEPETIKRLHAAPDEQNDYAFGWIATTRRWAGDKPEDRMVLTHGGSNTMWYCVTWIGPGKDLAVVVCTNAASPAATKAADEAAWMAIQCGLEQHAK